MNYKEVLKCLKMPNYVSNDFYSMLFARSIGGTAGYGELTGTPPLTFVANGRNLINYRIYGANDGVGERTENLFDVEEIAYDGYSKNNFYTQVSSNNICAVIKRLEPNTNYYITWEFSSTSKEGVYNQLRIYAENTLIGYINSGYAINFTQEVIDSITNVIAYFGTGNTDGYYKNFTLVQGSTAPTQYIPYGYQLNAVVRSENLFDGQIEQGYYAFLDGQRSTTSYIAQEWVCTTLVPCNGNTAYSIRAELSIELKSRSYGVVWFDSSLNFISSNSFSTLANPVIFDVMSPSSAAYYAVNISGTYGDTSMTPNNINNITIIAGSTAPTQYIPYSRTDIPIYIGDTPLAQGEYADYGEQKVYKYVDNVLTPTDPPVALPALPTIDGKTIVDFDNTPKPSEMYIKYPK